MSEFKNDLYEEFERKLRAIFTNSHSLDKTQGIRLLFIAKRDIQIISNSYELLSQNKGVHKDDLEVIINGDTCTLKTKKEETQLPTKDLLRVFVYLLDAFTPIYPLGTLVSLKKEYLHKLLDNHKVDKVHFVITKRFIHNDTTPVYFSYAGTPYPINNLGLKNDFYFTDTLIDEVIHMGYEDEQEDVFVFMMKKELLLDKQYKSVGYASEEERKQLMGQGEQV